MRLWLTFDIEEDRHCNFPSIGAVSPSVESIEGKLEMISEFLSLSGLQATFFVVGEIAKKYAPALKRLHEQGHEIACHSMRHKFVAAMSAVEFRDDTALAKRTIEDSLGIRVLGYRAPSWSVKEGMPWFYEILAELGFKYSSSVFPIKNYLYGIDHAPIFPYYPRVSLSRSEVIEIPVPVFELGSLRIPYNGGFYFRALPEPLSAYLHRKFSDKWGAGMFYLHPGDFGISRSYLPPGLLDRVVHSYGVRSAWKKAQRLLQKSSSVSVWDYIFIHRNHSNSILQASEGFLK